MIQLPYDTRRDHILGFIDAFHSKHKYPPSIREIAEATEMSKSRVFELLQRMKDEGVITVRGGPRSIRINQTAMVHLKETL